VQVAAADARSVRQTRGWPDGFRRPVTWYRTAMNDSDQAWARLQYYRRVNTACATVIAVVILGIAILRSERALLIGTCIAVLAFGGVIWSDIQVGRTACPHCRYRLRSIDALFWKRCRHCERALIRGSAA
jgi:hypothetical protein